MKRIILHIGTEKTATTSLQSFFAQNATALSEKGIWYPCDESLDYCHRSAHFPLAASLNEDCPDYVSKEKHFVAEPLFAGLLSDFRSRPEPTLLISCEHFSSRCSRPEKNARLARILKGWDVQILVYLRPQHEMLLSSYSTFLKSGGKKTLDHVSREMWIKPKAMYFNHNLMVERWLENFPLDAMNVRIFQDESMTGGNIYRDVLAFLETDLEKPKYPERLNSTISRELAEFLYLANQHFAAPVENNRPLWERGQRFRASVIPCFGPGTPIRHLLSRELYEDTREFFADYNRSLCDRVRPDLAGKLFSEPRHGIELTGPGMGNQNFYTPELVAWIIDQWEAGQPFYRKLRTAVN